MKVVKKVITVCVSVVLWLVILLAALFAFTTLATRDNTKVANLAGYTPMVVKTDSMSPTFNSGDLIVIKSCDTATLKEGDIITFHTIIQNEYALNTHRIDKIEEKGGARSYVTKGDNNAMADTHIISDGDIVGMYVTRVPGLGFVMDFLSSSTGFLLVIVLPMLLFFIYQVYHLIMVSINLKKAIAVEAAMEKEKKLMEMREASAAVPVKAEETQAAPAPVKAEEKAPVVAPAPDESQKAVQDETDAILAEAQRIRAEAQRMKAQAEAVNALAEAKRLQAEAQAELEKAKKESEQ